MSAVEVRPKSRELTADALPPGAQHLYQRLHCASLGRSNDEWLARMLVSQAWGMGIMPRRLGLSLGDFSTMMVRHFPGVSLAPFLCGHELDRRRLPEFEDLRRLFLTHGEERDETAWLATMLAAGCMGGDHLWQDMGLWSRRDLSALIASNFPALAARNEHDMKWKKFFYKQLCLQEGIYACRAPSCQVCSDYAACFGPE
ncbi:MAG: nitrogen fixation protein NifQ [Thiohalomonadaceae bacterium]